MSPYEKNMSLQETLFRAYYLMKNKISSYKNEKEMFESISFCVDIINILKNNLSDSSDAKSLLLFYNSMLLDLINIHRDSKNINIFLKKIDVLLND